MPEIILITCSGISSTGKLTSQAAGAFMKRHPGILERHIPAQSLNSELHNSITEDTKLIILEGCEDCCACKKLTSLDLEADIHITATDLGIVKRGAEDPFFSEINTVLQELRIILKKL